LGDLLYTRRHESAQRPYTSAHKITGWRPTAFEPDAQNCFSAYRV